MNMKNLTLVPLVVLAVLVGSTTVMAQTQGRSVTLVKTSIGLVEGNSTGTLGNDNYIPDQGYEFCLKDVAWRVSGTPGANVTVGAFNSNINDTDGSAAYWLFRVHPTLNCSGVAGGTESFNAGARLTTTGRLVFWTEGTTTSDATLYGIERPISGDTPCFP